MDCNIGVIVIFKERNFRIMIKRLIIEFVGLYIAIKSTYT